MKRERKQKHVLPGFRLTMTFTLIYLLLIVIVPLFGLGAKTATTGWSRFYGIATSARAVASLRLSFGASFAAALANVFFGMIVAWTLVRYSFPGKRLLD